MEKVKLRVRSLKFLNLYLLQMKKIINKLLDWIVNGLVISFVVIMTGVVFTKFYIETLINKLKNKTHEKN